MQLVLERRGALEDSGPTTSRTPHRWAFSSAISSLSVNDK